MSDSFYFGLVITALMLAVGHWLPWPARLPRMLAYAYGLGAILVGLAVWLLPDGWRLWLGILAYCLTGGLATLAAYAYDAWRNNAVRRALDDDDGPRRHP